MRLRKAFKPVILAGALVLAPFMASAATITLSAQNSGNVFGSNGSSTATITETTLRPSGISASAGGFALKGDLHGTGVENFTAWCLDIATTLKLSSNYEKTITPFAGSTITSTTLTNITRLFETGLKTLDLTSNAKSAGFQLALWEVLYEKSGTFDLSHGNFKVTNSSAAIAAGTALLAGMSGVVNQHYDLTYLQSVNHYSQNLVTATAVPLPAAGFLLLGAFGGLTLLRRRKA